MWRAASPTTFIPLPMCLSALGNCQSKKVKRKQHHTSPFASLCITVLGRGFIYFQGNRVLKKSIEAKSMEGCPTDCTQSQARSK
jgi:hypothetical protein